jgi:DnaJ-class molecular chaperone
MTIKNAVVVSILQTLEKYFGSLDVRQGGAGVNSGPNGDLYLTIKIVAHPEFLRKGNDLQRDFPVE